MVSYADSEAMVTQTRLPILRCLRGEGYVAQCSAGAGRGHSTRTQWPVIPAAPCPGRYGVDVTSCPVGHSMVSSRRLAEIAGVVDALMGRDALSGRLVQAGVMGYREASFERYGELLSRLRLYARGLGRDRDWAPCRGLPREASREADISSGCRDLPCEASGEAESRWAWSGLVVNPWLTF